MRACMGSSVCDCTGIMFVLHILLLMQVRPKMGKLTIDYQKLHDTLFRYVHTPVCAIPLVFTMYDQLIRIYVVVAPMQYPSAINLWLSKP